LPATLPIAISVSLGCGALLALLAALLRRRRRRAAALGQPRESRSLLRLQVNGTQSTAAAVGTLHSTLGTSQQHTAGSAFPQLSAGEHAIAFSELEIQDLLGTGGFGAVYRAVWRPPRGAPCVVAVKMLHASSVAGVSEFEKEIAILSRLAHRNIVRFIGACLEGGPAGCCLVEELVTGGSLQDFLHGPSGRRCSHREALRIAEGVASAMSYLHEQRVVHRDLKAANVLLVRLSAC